MDISYKYENQKFNYRVCAMIISGNKILTMNNRRTFTFPAEELRWGKQLSRRWYGKFRKNLV